MSRLDLVAETFLVCLGIIAGLGGLIYGIYLLVERLS